MKRSDPGLYNILTWNWCILRRMHCIPCDSVATSFLNIATSGLWSAVLLISLAKQQWWNLSRPCNIPNASLLMLPYLCSSWVRLLLENVIDLSMVLSSGISLDHIAPSLFYNRVATSSIPDAPVSRYRVWFLYITLYIQHLLLVILPCWTECVWSIPCPYCFAWCQLSQLFTHISSTRRNSPK